MKLMLPSQLAARGEPLLAAGAMYGSDMVFVREAGDGRLKFVFEHIGSPEQASQPLALDRAREHEVEIAFPSLADESFGHNGTGEVWVRVNGAEALRVKSAVYDFPPGHPALGRNPFGTTCAPEFRGWINEARWIAISPDAPKP